MKTKIKLSKLDARGFSHAIGMMAFAVIFAIVGVGYLVASHADTCDPVSGATSAATSGATSGASCNPASGAVSSTNPTTAGTCTISGVPANPAYGQQIAPAVTYKNTGTKTFSVAANGQMEVFGSNNATRPDYPSVPIKAISLNPGQTVTVDTGLRYTVAYSSATVNRVTFAVNSSSPMFSCSAGAALPAAPAPAPAPGKLAGTCTISGVPSRPAYKQVIRPYVTIVNTGNVAFQPKTAERLSVGNYGVSRNRTLATLKPQGATKQALSTYTTQRKSNSATQGTYRVTSTQPSFSCSATFKLP